MTKKEQLQADKRVERVYRARCANIQIDLFDISKVFAEGRKAIAEGVTDEVLGDRVRAFVEALRS